MRILLFSFLSAVLIFAASCDVKLANEPQVKTIDSTLATLNSTIEALDTIDISSFNEIATRIEKLDTEAWTYFENDDTAKFWKHEIADLQLCIRSLGRYAKESKSIAMALNENKKQLETLKHDLENNLVEKEKVDEYVGTEVVLTTQTISRAAKRGGRALYCIQNYDSIIFKADSILNVLRPQN
jgi:hypothetical protein